MDELLASRLSLIKHRVAVMSGKGGVGKTTVAVNLAVALAGEGRSVGILDGDVHGPNVPKMFGLEGRQPRMSEHGLEPIVFKESIKVMSMAFMLPNPDTPVIWRGPVKHTVFKQFLAEVNWGNPPEVRVGIAPPWWSLYSSICDRSDCKLNFKALIFASLADDENWGMIVAAKTAMITTTIKTSISVKAERRRFALIMIENSSARLVANPVMRQVHSSVGARTSQSRPCGTLFTPACG